MLRDHCARESRDYDDVRRTILWNAPVAVDAEGGAEFVEQMRADAGLGVQEVHVMPLPGAGAEDPAGFVRGLGERVVVPLHAL